MAVWLCLLVLTATTKKKIWMAWKAGQGAPYGGFDAGNGPWGSIHGGPAFAPAPSQSLPSTLHAPCTFREYSLPTTTTPLGNQPGGSVRGAPEGPRSTTTGKGRKAKKKKKKNEAGGRASMARKAQANTQHFHFPSAQALDTSTQHSYLPPSFLA